MDLDLSAIRNRQLKSQVVDLAYSDGFTGCYLPENGGEHGAVEQKLADQFRDSAGRNSYRATDSLSSLRDDDLPPFRGIEGLHVRTAYAFEQFKQHGDGYANTIYAMLQNSGCCVGASFKEMMDSLLGIQSHTANTPYRMLACASMSPYWRRGGCGQGWYMGACAAVVRERGWCPAVIFDGRQLGTLTVPDYRDLEMDGENELEQVAVRTFCRSRPDVIEDWMAENFMFDDNGIAEVDDWSGEAQKAIAQQGGHIHHGSNHTSGRSVGSVRRIGGHAQTDYGADWSDDGLDWWRQRGMRDASPSNPVKLQGQTWGPSGGNISDEDWPFGSDDRGNVISQADVVGAASDPPRLMDLIAATEGHWGYGPKPEGSWVVTASTLAKYFSSRAYAYFPRFQGIPVSDPQPPTPQPVQHPTIHGSVFVDGHAIRGKPYFFDADGRRHDYLIVPHVDGTYRFANRTDV